MRCDKHSEQNSRCNIEKRQQIFLASTDPTTWDVKSGASAVITHVIHVYNKKKKVWYVFCGYIKLQASLVIRKENYKAFAASLWPPHKRHAGETGGGTFYRISSWWHGLDKAVFRIRGWEVHTKMKHDVDHYYEAVLGITRRAGEVRPSDFHTFSWYFETQEKVFDSAILTCPHVVYGLPFCLHFTGIFFVR